MPADATRAIAILEAENGRLKAALADSQRHVRAFARGSEAAARRTEQSWKAAADGLQRQLVAAATGVAFAFGAATKQAIEFERTMRNVNSIVKLPESQFRALNEQVLELARNLGTTQGPRQMAAALYDINSAGFGASDGIKVLEASAVAATAGLTDARTAADGITTVLNAYGLAATEAARVSDIMFKTVEVGKTEFPQLASNLGQVATIAKNANVSFEEVGAGLAVLTAKGLSTEEATVALRGAILKMLDPSKESRALMDALGIEYGSAALEAKGLGGVLRDLEARAGGNKDIMLQLVGDVRAFNGVLGLVGDDGAKSYLKAVDQMAKSMGSTRSAVEEQTKAVSAQWEIFIAQAEAAGIELSTAFLPTLKEMTEGLQEVTRWFHELSDAQKQQVIDVGLAVAALGGLVLAGKVLAGGWAVLVGAYAAMDAALAVTAGALIALGPHLATAAGAVGRLALAIASMHPVLRGVSLAVTAFGGTVYGLGKVFDEVEHRAAQFGERAFEQWKTAIRDSFAKPLADGTDSALQVLTNFRDQVVGIFGDIRDSMAAAFSPLAELGGQVKTSVSTAGKALKGLLPDFLAGDRPSTPEPARRTAAEAAAIVAGLEKKEEKGPKPFDRAEAIAFIRQHDPDAAGLAGLTDEALKATRALVERAKDARLRILITSGKRSGGGRSFHDHGEAIDFRVLGEDGDLGTREFAIAQELLSGTGFRTGLNELRPDVRAITGGTGPHLHATTGRENQSTLGFFQVDESDPVRKVMEEERQAAEERSRELTQWRTEWEALRREGLDPFVARMLELEDILRRLREEGVRLGVPQEELAALEQIVSDARSQARAEEAGRIFSAGAQFDPVAPTRVNIDEEIAAFEEVQARKLEARLRYIDQDYQLGLIDLEQKLALMEQEYLAFEGSEERKRQLLVDLHSLRTQIHTEQQGQNQQLLASMQAGFTGFLQGTLSGQRSFGEAFKSLWQQIANTFLQHIGQMIVKALALQKVLNAIMGFFGFSPFGGIAASLAGNLGGAAQALSGLVGGHTGGVVVPHGIQHFHSGGLVGSNLRGDEVLAKLQVGEVVLPRHAVDQAREGRAVQVHVDNYNSYTQADVGEFAGRLGWELQARLGMA